MLVPPDDQSDGTAGTTGRAPTKRRRFGPISAGMQITVPPGESDHLLRTIERIAVAGIWAGTVTGTLFGAAAANLPPASTVTLVVLEIAAAVTQGTRRRNKK
jgi:hypothetical protein